MNTTMIIAGLFTLRIGTPTPTISKVISQCRLIIPNVLSVKRGYSGRGLRMSDIEETLAFQMKAYNLDPLRQYKFHPKRKYLADFCIPEHLLIVECNGHVDGEVRTLDWNRNIQGLREIKLRAENGLSIPSVHPEGSRGRQRYS
jgi:hypothetical protein